MLKLVSLVIALTFIGSAWGAPPPSTPDLLKKGEASFQTNCASCHGATGEGNGPAGQYLTPKPRNFAKDKFKKGDGVEQIFQTVSNGLDGTPMVSFGHLPEEERWGLAYFVKHFRPAGKEAKPKKKK